MQINYIHNKEKINVGDFVIATNGEKDFLYLIIGVNYDEFDYGLLDLESFKIKLFLEDLDHIKESEYLGDNKQIRNIIKSKNGNLEIVMS
jgi:hypothetical protein